MADANVVRWRPDEVVSAPEDIERVVMTFEEMLDQAIAMPASVWLG